MKGYQRLAAAEAAFDRISGLPDRDAALDAVAAWSLMEEGAGPALELAVLRREVLAAMTTPLTLDEVGFALLDLMEEQGRYVLSRPLEVLAPMVAEKAVERMRLVIDEYEEVTK